MIEFKNVNIVQHRNYSIGFCVNEEDGNTIMKTYFYLSMDQESYYLYNPMYTTFKIDGVDEI